MRLKFDFALSSKWELELCWRTLLWMRRVLPCCSVIYKTSSSEYSQNPHWCSSYWFIHRSNKSRLTLFQVSCKELCIALQCKWLWSSPSGVPPQGRLRLFTWGSEAFVCWRLEATFLHAEGMWFHWRPSENWLWEIRWFIKEGVTLIPGQIHFLSCGKLLSTLFLYWYVFEYHFLVSMMLVLSSGLQSAFEKEFHHYFFFVPCPGLDAGKICLVGCHLFLIKTSLSSCLCIFDLNQM